MLQTVCAETGVPAAPSVAAISITERSRARSASTSSRTLPALRGPFGPGLLSRKKVARPARRSEAI